MANNTIQSETQIKTIIINYKHNLGPDLSFQLHIARQLSGNLKLVVCLPRGDGAI